MYFADNAWFPGIKPPYVACGTRKVCGHPIFPKAKHSREIANEAGASTAVLAIAIVIGILIAIPLATRLWIFRFHSEAVSSINLALQSAAIANIKLNDQDDNLRLPDSKTRAANFLKEFNPTVGSGIVDPSGYNDISCLSIHFKQADGTFVSDTFNGTDSGTRADESACTNALSGELLADLQRMHAEDSSRNVYGLCSQIPGDSYVKCKAIPSGAVQVVDNLGDEPSTGTYLIIPKSLPGNLPQLLKPKDQSWPEPATFAPLEDVLPGM
jgi:hypothetical protein